MKDYALQSYQLNQFWGTDAIDLLLKLYRAALRACRAQDRERAAKILWFLSNALDFKADPALALSLFRTYEYCFYRLFSGQFDEVASVIEALQEHWSAIKKGERKPRWRVPTAA